MRIWHYELLPYLPDLQFKGQLREIIAIMHDWRDKGTTNHLLVNNVMDYPKEELFAYYDWYYFKYYQRYNKCPNAKYDIEFREFAPKYGVMDYFEDLSLYDYDRNCVIKIMKPIYNGWHNKEYLRINMANLYEKYKFGKGKRKITDEEWIRLLDGYRQITGEEYVV